VSRPARIHYLRENAGERSPRRLLVLDTEAEAEQEGPRELQVMRLWAGRLGQREPETGAAEIISEAWGTSRQELAEYVLECLSSKTTTWCFTHNLSYDLVTTNLVVELLSRGFRMGQHNLASEAPWGLLRKGSKALRLADSASYLPVPVWKLGQALGLGKPALPEPGADDLRWLERCQADLDITWRALLRLMAEWDRLRLGWWSLTGPATAWNSMLHLAPKRYRRRRRARSSASPHDARVPTTAVPVIDPSPEARAFEREAIFSGRRDLWRWGALEPGPYAYLDFRSAHLLICAYHNLPDRRLRGFGGLELGDPRLRSQVKSLLADCVVRCSEPRYPLRWKGTVLHPVGLFQTRLCGPEIAEALERGELCSVGAGYFYRLGQHMQPWAQWAYQQLNDPDQECDPILAVFLKGASRSVPGRWAMQVSAEGACGPSHRRDWWLERSTFGQPPRRGAILHLAGEWLEIIRGQEWEESFPAVLAHIQAWVRLYLNRALAAVGEQNVLQVNTDALLLPERRLAGLGGEDANPGQSISPDLVRLGVEAISRQTYPLELRIKATAQEVELLSPQHLKLDGQRLYSGVPAGPETRELKPNVFQFWTWPKLAGQLEKGDPRGYVRQLRTVNLSGLPVNRWAYEDGCCEPVEAAWAPATGNRLLPPAPPRLCRHNAPLRASQHPILAELL
jgi:hypothetical protein